MLVSTVMWWGQWSNTTLSLYISINVKLVGFLWQPIRISSLSSFSCRAEPASDRMTPLWSPCRRVWEAVSHYLFNALARAAHPHPGGVKLHFKPRCFPPGQFGGEQMKGPQKQHLSLTICLSSMTNSFLSWISRRWAVWTPTMRTAQKFLSRCSTVTPLPK